MTRALRISSSVAIPAYELLFSFSRASGPGGQNVNKVSSKATLHWYPLKSGALSAAQRHRFQERFGGRLTHDGAIVIVSSRFRDQKRNVEECLQKLRMLVQQILSPPKKRVATRPSRAVKERRLSQKRLQSEKKRARKEPGDPS